MDPSTRGPFIRGVVVAAVLAVFLFGGTAFKRSGVSFDYEIVSQTKLPDGREVEAHWAGSATETRNRLRYETHDEQSPALPFCRGKQVRYSQRHIAVESRGRGEEVQDYRTKRYRVTETDTIWYVDVEKPATARVVTDYWVAPSLQHVAEPVLTFADSVNFSRAGLELPRRAGQHTARLHHFVGTPIRIVSRALFIDPDGERFESETTSELSNIERGRKFNVDF